MNGLRQYLNNVDILQLGEDVVPGGRTLLYKRERYIDGALISVEFSLPESVSAGIQETITRDSVSTDYRSASEQYLWSRGFIERRGNYPESTYVCDHPCRRSSTK
jgi:hypothetical protein